MSRNLSRIARRETRGHASMASFVHAEGQKVIPAWQQRYMDRVREGRCPRCNEEVDKDTREGKVIVKGRVVHTCVECRLKRQIAREEAKTSEPVEQEKPVGTLLGERISKATEIDLARERFEQARDSKILIVGVKPNNLQRMARGNDRVILWESTDRFRGATPIMPTNVSVVMCTRFCSHQVSQDLRRMANDRKAFMFSGLVSPGEVRKNLVELLQLDSAKTHEGASDENLGEVEMPPVAKPLPSPTPRLVAAPPPPTTPTPKPEVTMAQPQPAMFGSANPDAVLDDAVEMLGNGIAAMQLAKEQLIKAKQQLALAKDQQAKLDAENAAAAQKLNALRDLLKNI